MRNIIIAITAAILLPLYTMGQSSGKDLISISYHNGRLRQILNDISSQCGVLFVYSTEQVNDQVCLDIKVRNKNLDNVMSQISEMMAFEYIRLEKQIILKPRKKEHTSQYNSEKNKNASISGYITDGQSREPLIGASVTVEGQSIGTTTNAVGYYTLSLPKDSYSLVFSYLGYKREYISINLTANTEINQQLEPTERQLEAIHITSQESQTGAKELINKGSSLNAGDFNRYSGLVLGGDLVGILSTDHGITRLSDGSAFYSVRGGFKDQNMVLIDEAPIYHPSHLFGLYSSVSPQAINALEVYTSDFPLKYGGRLSSITDIRTKDGSLGKLGFSGEWTPLTVSGRLETPILHDRITATANIRKSTLGWGAYMLNRDGDFSFYDAHAKIHFKISDRHRMYLSVFNGNDYYSNLETGNNYAVSWRNVASTLRHYHIINSKLSANNTLYFGQYKYQIYTSEDHNDYWNTRIGNISLKGDLVYEPSAKHTIRAGAEYSFHIFTPATLYLNRLKSNSGLLTGNADNITLYIGAESQINKKIAVKYGTRLSVWNNYGPAKSFFYNDTIKKWDTTSYSKGIFNTYHRIEPRVAVLIKPNNKVDVKLSCENNVQFQHMLSNSISPFTTLDLWIPSGNYFKPQDVIAANLTANLRLREITITLCGFHKYYRNLTEYKLHANMLMNKTIENEFYLGEAICYGMEVSIEKTAGRFRTKAFYSYTSMHKKTPDLYDYSYIPDNSIPHTIHLMAQYNITKKLVAKADWNFNTGIPYTQPEGFYYYEDYKLPYYGARNNARLPNYHKLNIAMEYGFARPRIKGFSHKVILSVYNVYNRNNFVMVSYNKIKTPSGSYMIPSNYVKENQFVSTGMALPGLTPMLSYRIQIQQTK
ncbi:MAG: TonB-dependent receptor [Bacteroidales bacterium]|nr:TonB-dependent receptor [Bacteroidales bacterium]